MNLPDPITVYDKEVATDIGYWKQYICYWVRWHLTKIACTGKDKVECEIIGPSMAYFTVNLTNIPEANDIYRCRYRLDWLGTDSAAHGISYRQ